MTSPVPGFTPPNPRTWSTSDFITTPRLRGDMTNLGFLYAGGARPMLLAGNFQNQTTSGAGVLPLFIGNNVALNTWNVTVIPTGATVIPYQIPFAGYWLAQADATFTSSAAAATFGTGFTAVVNGGGSFNTDGAILPGSSASGAKAGGAACELFQFNTYAATADTLGYYARTSDASPVLINVSFLMAEWVGLPTSGLTGYAGPYGTVVSPPAAAAPFPPGPGTTLAAPVSAGATSVTVASNTGMIVGGYLGLDYLNGQLYRPVAEVVSITSVAGTTIGISAAAFAHSSGAPVAVPVSSAFMNQQCRDIIRFLAYPPLLRAATTTTQALTSGSNTQITNLAASIDTFTGFSSNEYTIPVAGTYLVYGQVYLAGSTSAFAATVAIEQNSTFYYGTSTRAATTSALPVCATVRRLLRCAAGDTIKLYGFQNSGSSMNTVASSAYFSKLICCWRST